MNEYGKGYEKGWHSAMARIIRCSDCKHWGGVVFGNVCCRWSAPLAGVKNCTKPDDYCSYAERKEL